MNYLAHLYLSGDSPGVLIGNFIGDHVKGRRFTRYHGDYQTGILLHRHIDAFTDSHPVFKESAKNFKEGYGRYAGVVTDVIYDHFLAAYWDHYSNVTLTEFVKNTHRIFIRNYFRLPSAVKQFLPFLIKSRRLESYKNISGIERALRIISSNSSLPAETDFAIQNLQRYYHTLHDQFSVFMPDIIASCSKFLEASGTLYSPDHSVISR